VTHGTPEAAGAADVVAKKPRITPVPMMDT